MEAMLWVVGGWREACAPFEDLEAIEGGGCARVGGLPSAESVLKSEPMVTLNFQCTTWEGEGTVASKKVWMAADVLKGVGPGGEWAENGQRIDRDGVSGRMLNGEGIRAVNEGGEVRICIDEYYMSPIGTLNGLAQQSQQERAGTGRAASSRMATALTQGRGL